MPPFEAIVIRADERFTTTVHGAYVIIGITGFSWGLAQCLFVLFGSRIELTYRGTLFSGQLSQAEYSPIADK
jgi:hypothetical protein